MSRISRSSSPDRKDKRSTVSDDLFNSIDQPMSSTYDRFDANPALDVEREQHADVGIESAYICNERSSSR